MCAGAIVHVRLARVVFGTTNDDKAGAAGSALNLLQFPTLNHRLRGLRTVCANPSAARCSKPSSPSSGNSRRQAPAARSRMVGTAAEAVSTDGYQRRLFPLMIAGDALSVRVEDGFPIHQEPVMMMPVIQRDLEEPGAIRLAFHRVCRRVPIIEIAGQKDLLGSRCIAHKIDRLRHLLGGIAVRGERKNEQ